MGKSQFLLLNPNGVRAQLEAVAMIGVQKVRISIRARRFNLLHKKAGYMTDALFSSKKLLTHTDGPYMTVSKGIVFIRNNSFETNLGYR